MSINWGIYDKRLNINGFTERERNLSNLKDNISKHIEHSLSCKDVLLNEKAAKLIINTGKKSCYKEFEALPGQPVEVGDYVKWANRTWLVYEADSDDEVYIDGKMYECNYKLYWQDSSGKIISRWAYIQNASSYSNGESGNSTLTLSSNQFLVIMPLDDDTINLTGIRMIIDNVTSGNPSPYELTRPDNVSMKFGDKGCTYYIFTLKEFSMENDKRVTLEDGSQVWICNYITSSNLPVPIENPDKTTVHLAISSIKDYLIIGGAYATFKGIVADGVGTWTINCDFPDKLITDISDNQIKIKISDDSLNLIGMTFTLVFTINGTSVSKDIAIKE